MLTPDDPRHGSLTGYNHHRCRCPRCRKASMDYLREWRIRRGYQQLRPDPRRLIIACDNPVDHFLTDASFEAERCDVRCLRCVRGVAAGVQPDPTNTDLKGRPRL